jgi:hypothetical protein
VTKLQVKLEAKLDTKIPDIGVIEVGQAMDKINPEKLKNVFYSIAEFNIRAIIKITKRQRFFSGRSIG